MRIALVGSSADRERLRAELDGSIEVAAEFDSLSAAQTSDVAFDALIMADARVRGAEELASDEPLTTREMQVLERLAEGLPNKAIAERLGISDQTVKFHVASISGKLGARNRTDAVRRAVRRGLIVI